MISHPGPCLSTSKLFTKCADLIKVGWTQQTRCCQIYCYCRHCFSHRQTCHSRQSPPQPKRCLWCKKMSDLRELPELSFIPIIITLIIFFVEKQKNMIWLIRSREWCARDTWAALTLRASTWTVWGTQWITASISTQIQTQMILAEMWCE